MRISVLTIGAIASIITTAAFANQVITSQTYVDNQDALKVNIAQGTGTNNANVGKTLVVNSQGNLELGTIDVPRPTLRTNEVVQRQCVRWSNSQHTDENCLLWDLVNIYANGYPCTQDSDCETGVCNNVGLCEYMQIEDPGATY